MSSSAPKKKSAPQQALSGTSSSVFKVTPLLGTAKCPETQSRLRDALRETRANWPDGNAPRTRRRSVLARLERFIRAERLGAVLTMADRALYLWASHQRSDGPMPPQPDHPAEGPPFDAHLDWLLAHPPRSPSTRQSRGRIE